MPQPRMSPRSVPRRSPHGERGLKLCGFIHGGVVHVALLMESVD